jgi:uncharacterized repeat protein (TIGR01451 family)
MKRLSAKLLIAAGAVSLTLGLTGASAVTTPYTEDLSAVPVTIDDNQGTFRSLNVADTGKIADVDVSVLLQEPASGNLADIDLVLRHPDNTTVPLALDNGGLDTDYGSGSDCNGPMTVFDDEATASIDSATPPYDGSFKPEQPLSVLDGKPANGAWRLEISDDTAGGGEASLLCWRITITFAPSSDLVVTLTDSPDPVNTGESLTYTATIMNNGPEAAPDAKLTLTLPSGAEVVTTTTSLGTCTGSGPVTCSFGVLAVGGSPTSVTVVAKPTEAGSAVAAATGSTAGTELVPANNVASTTTTVNDAGGGGGSGGSAGPDLTVTLSGEGQGEVTSAPAGIACGNDCGSPFDPGTEVTLTAAAAAGSTPGAWGGACAGVADAEPCVVTMDDDLTVTKAFTKDGGGSQVYDICTIVGTNGPDVLRGTNNKDVICGLGGNDKIYGNAGNDRIYGGAGRDKLFGGSGNDTFFSKDRFKDAVNGGSGRDRVKPDGRDAWSNVETIF